MKIRDMHIQTVLDAAKYVKVKVEKSKLKKLSDKSLKELVDNITLFNEYGDRYLLADTIKAIN